MRSSLKCLEPVRDERRPADSRLKTIGSVERADLGAFIIVQDRRRERAQHAVFFELRRASRTTSQWLAFGTFDGA